VPEWCVTMRCIDCSSHAIIGGKLDCNFMNRLGLAQPEVKDFIAETYQAPEQIEAQLKDAEERIKKIKEEQERLKALQEGKKDTDVSKV